MSASRTDKGQVYFARIRAWLAVICLCYACLQTGDAATIIPKHSKKFTRYDNCELVSTEYLDGDSFRVRIGEDEFVLRLYYVDAPESDERFPERNAEQAAYFGIAAAEALETGKAAKVFVHDHLAGKRFTIFTRWATALGSSKLPRYYAVVEIEGRGLDELLIENGLARLKGNTVTHPNGTTINDHLALLWQLQEKARANNLGAWAKSRPELQETVVEEQEEAENTFCKPETLVAFSLGAGSIGLLWITQSLLRRRAVH